MTREHRRGPHGQAARSGSSHANPRDAQQAIVQSLTPEQQAAVEATLAQVPTLAAALRDAVAAGRDAVIAQLAPIRDLAEPVALAFALRLGEQRGAGSQDAADVAQAIGELETRKTVAREARRARLRLRSAGTPSALAVPLPAGQRSAVEPGRTAASDADATALESATPAAAHTGPQLVDAYATRSREVGEVTLVLGWQEGQSPNIVRGYALRLGLWREGVTGCIVTDPMSKQRFHKELVEGLHAETQVQNVAITWAQARRLVLEALAVNAWRGTEPDAEFQRHRSQLDARLLAEPEDEAARAAVAEETRRVAQEGDAFLIAGDMEPEETLLNWIGAWSFGDFALAYDLLADDHPARRSQTREEYVALRRQWASDADPSGLRLTLVREQVKRASALWVPPAVGTVGAGERKDLEAFWSVVMHESQIGGQIEELPLATLSSRESGRHWYWTGYTLVHDRALSLWRISRSRDEGAASQALTIEEVQRRLTEAHETVEKITHEPPPEPGSERADELLRTLTGTLTAALHYSDALTVRLPLDEGVYRTALTDARSLGNHERAAALLEKMQGRFADHTRMQFELGIEQYLVSDQYAQQGQNIGAADWLERAVSTLRAVVAAEPTAEHLQGLGELLARQGHFGQAEETLRQAIALDPQRAMLHSDLADTLIAGITGEDLDLDAETGQSQVAPEERQRVAQEALAALRQASILDATIPGLYTRMGAIYDILQQPEDALVALEEGVRHDPGDVEAHYALGSLYLARRQPERAVASLETAVQLMPMAVPYRLNLAACYMALERLTDATSELDMIDRLQPGLPQVAELRGLLAKRRKQR